MVEVTKVKINLSRSFQLGSEKFRRAFFTTPQSGLLFNDEGYNHFQKKYTFDFSKFTEVIEDKGCQEFKLVQPLLAKLREQIAPEQDIPVFLRQLKPGDKNFSVVSRLVREYIFGKDEGKDLLVSYQKVLRANREVKVSFNDYIKSEVLDNWANFQQRYPTISKSIEIGEDGAPKVGTIVAELYNDPQEFEIQKNEAPQLIQAAVQEIRCSLQDLADYVEVSGEEKISFVEYIRRVKQLSSDVDIMPDLSGRKIHGMDLTGLDLSNVNFSGTYFAGNTLTNVNFSGCKMVGTTSFRNGVDGIIAKDIITHDISDRFILEAPKTIESEDLKELGLKGKINDEISYSFFRDEDQQDYNVGFIETRLSLFKEGDFSGCSLKNIEFQDGVLGNRLDEISFRDGQLTNVGFTNVYLSKADFRGVRQHNVVFDNYAAKAEGHDLTRIEGLDLATSGYSISEPKQVGDYQDLSQIRKNRLIDSLDLAVVSKGPKNDQNYFAGLKLDFTDIKIVQKYGLVDIKDRNKVAKILGSDEATHFESKFQEYYKGEYKQKIEKVFQDLKAIESANQGVLSSIVSYVSESLFSMTIEQIENNIERMLSNGESLVNKSNMHEFNDIKVAWRKARREKHNKERSMHMQVNEALQYDLAGAVKLDQTYTRGADYLDKKILVQCGKEELEQYLKSGDKKKISFAQYLQENTEGIADDKVVVPSFAEGVDLSNMDLRGLDLSGVIMAKANLTNTNFNGARLVGSSLEGAIVDDANFSKTVLTDANLICVSGENVSFVAAEGARLRLAGAALGSRAPDRKADFTKARFDALDARKGDFENSILKNAQMQYADFSEANMIYVNAKNAKLRGANLSNALITCGDFTEANLSEAVLDGVDGFQANFKKAQMEKVNAFKAKLQEAIFEKVNAQEANFTRADLSFIKALEADFTASIMESTKAANSDFSKAILTRVKAKRANFEKAVLDEIEAEQIDVRDAVLRNARLHSAKLERALMSEVKADNADFTGAVMNDMEADLAKFANTCFQNAQLRRVIINGANCNNTDFSNADLTGVYSKMDKETPPYLVNSNFQGTVGAEELIELRAEQIKAQNILTSTSQYGYCEDPKARLAAQKLGLAVLTGLSAGVAAGFYSQNLYLGQVVGGAAGVVSRMTLSRVSEEMLSSTGYIDNILGDRLAEIGAIAAAMGAEAAEVKVNEALACAVLGNHKVMLLNNARLVCGSGFDETKIFNVAVKSIASSAMPVKYQNFVHGYQILSRPDVSDRLSEAMHSMREFEENKDGSTKQGKKPEEVYVQSMQKLNKQVSRIKPTYIKVVLCLICAVALASLAYSLPAIVALVVGQAAAGATASFASATGLTSIAACFGGAWGYLYGEERINKTYGWMKNLVASKTHDVQESSEVAIEQQPKKEQETQQDEFIAVGQSQPVTEQDKQVDGELSTAAKLEVQNQEVVVNLEQKSGLSDPREVSGSMSVAEENSVPGQEESTSKDNERSSKTKQGHGAFSSKVMHRPSLEELKSKSDRSSIRDKKHLTGGSRSH